MDVFLVGKEIFNIIMEFFINVFGLIGGGGCILLLVIVILWVFKC